MDPTAQHKNRQAEFEGATVFAATRASDGLKLLAEKQVDLIVSDIAMPEMDGYGLLNALRSNPETQLTPFILLAAKVDEVAGVESL